MKTKNKKNTKDWLGRTFVRSAGFLLCLTVGVSDVKAALLWNWVSVGEGNTFSGTLTTDGDYSMTTPGSGLVTFTVLSFDSWFLNGTNLVTSGTFATNNWQTVGSPTVNNVITYTNTITWSRSEQKLDPLNGLAYQQSQANIATFPSDNHAALSIVNADYPNVDPSFLRNSIIQHATAPHGGAAFNLGFVATSTVFTPVPEPKFYAGCATLSLILVVYFRRIRATRVLEAAI